MIHESGSVPSSRQSSSEELHDMKDVTGQREQDKEGGAGEKADGRWGHLPLGEGWGLSGQWPN